LRLKELRADSSAEEKCGAYAWMQSVSRIRATLSSKIVGMYAVYVRPGLFAPNALLRVRVATFGKAIRFLESLSDSDYLVDGGNPMAIGESRPIYNWYECWFEGAEPIATIVRES
jgi:hypothetical protein